MGRKKLISESQIIQAKREIENGKSLRTKANELGIHPSSLADRLKKIKNQSSLLKPDTKPDIINIKPDTKKKKTNDNPTIPDTKPDSYISYINTDTLRAIHILLFSESTRDSKDKLLIKIMDKLKIEMDNK